MSKRDKEPADSDRAPQQETSLLIFATILDTTWRIFTPVIVLLVLGMWLDSKTGDKPFYALAGVVTGTVLAFALVALQYRQVTPKGKK